jgi:hypothetical protein
VSSVGSIAAKDEVVVIKIRKETQLQII